MAKTSIKLPCNIPVRFSAATAVVIVLAQAPGMLQSETGRYSNRRGDLLATSRAAQSRGFQVKIPTEPTASGLLFYFAFCVALNAAIWLVTPSFEGQSIALRGLWFLLRALLPLAIGAISSEVPTFFWMAVGAITVFTLAVTTEKFRSPVAAGMAFGVYGYTTIAVFWIEPFLVSTSSAAMHSVSVALIIKFGVGFFDLLFTCIWVYFPMYVAWKLRREFVAP